jgi:adenylate kinase
MVNNPPKVEGKCDLCGGELYQRPDDREEAVRKRIEVYHAQTMPLIDYYLKQGKLVEVDGEGSIDKISEDLIAAIGKRSEVWG